MLDFRLDEEQQMLTEAISRYSRERVRKMFRDAEEEGKIPQRLSRQDGKLAFCRPVSLRRMAGLGSIRPLPGRSPQRSLPGVIWQLRSILWFPTWSPYR